MPLLAETDRGTRKLKSHPNERNPRSTRLLNRDTRTKVDTESMDFPLVIAGIFYSVFRVESKSCRAGRT